MPTGTLYLIEDETIPLNTLGDWAQAEGALIVTLNARAAYRLAQQNISHKRCDEFYSHQEYELVGEGNFPKVLAFVRYMDDAFGRLDTLKQARLPIAESNYFFLKLLFDSVFLAVFAIHRVIAKTRPEKIVFAGWPLRDLPNELQFTNDETLYGRIVDIVAKAREIPMVMTAPASIKPNTRKTPNGFMRRIVEFLQAYAPQLALAKGLLRSVRWPHLIKSLAPKLSRPTFFISPVYDVGFVARAMVGRGIGPLYLIDPAFSKVTRFFPFFSWRTLKQPLSRNASGIAQTGRRLFEEQPFLDFFRFEGVNFVDAFRQKLTAFINRVFTDNLETYQSYYSFFAKHAGADVLMPTATDSQKEMILCAARHRGLKVYKYQHGSDGFFHFPAFEYYSLTNADGCLLYGSGVEEGISRHYMRHVRLMPVGSAALDNLKMTPRAPARAKGQRILQRQGVDLNRPIVVYPLSIMPFNRMYISYHLYPDWTYFQIQRRIADVFHAHPDSQLILKPHPSAGYPENPIISYLKDKQIANCHIIHEGSFVDLLYTADMFVMDLPSTVVLQAMTTAAKILIYNGIMRFEPEARASINKRCKYYEDFETFIKELEDTLQNHDFHNSLVDRSFLQLYGTHKDDGHSADRVISELGIAS